LHIIILLPSVLWHCWLGARKSNRPVKITDWWGVGAVMCEARLHMVQLMPLYPQTPSSLASFKSTGFTFLIPAYPGWKEAIKRMFSILQLLWLTYLHVCNVCVLGSSSGRLPTRSINTSHDFWLKDLQIFRFCLLFGKSYVFMFYLLVALCILFRLCSYVLVNLWSYNVHIMWRVKHTS